MYTFNKLNASRSHQRRFLFLSPSYNVREINGQRAPCSPGEARRGRLWLRARALQQVDRVDDIVVVGKKRLEIVISPSDHGARSHKPSYA